MTALKINAQDLDEYLSTLAQYADVPSEDDEKVQELIRSYAELKFKIIGGSKCGVCRAHVRHVVPVIAQKEDGQQCRFACLCTRCFEGEKATSEKMFLEMGESRVEVKRKRATREHVRMCAAHAGSLKSHV